MRMEISLSISGVDYDEKLDVTVRLKKQPVTADYTKIVNALQDLEDVYRKYATQKAPPAIVKKEQS